LIVEVNAEVAVVEPAELVAVTLTSTFDPTSADVSVYVLAVAPAMSLH
jgi:hypothetical protein